MKRLDRAAGHMRSSGYRGERRRGENADLPRRRESECVRAHAQVGHSSAVCLLRRREGECGRVHAELELRVLDVLRKHRDVVERAQVRQRGQRIHPVWREVPSRGQHGAARGGFGRHVGFNVVSVEGQGEQRAANCGERANRFRRGDLVGVEIQRHKRHDWAPKTRDERVLKEDHAWHL